MHQEVFKANLFKAIILPSVVAIVMLGVFIIADDIPPIFGVLFIVPIGIFLHDQRTKLIINDDILVYEYGIFFMKRNEAHLKDVSQIVMRQIETYEEDSDGDTQRVTKKIVYVLDENRRTFFSFPANILGRKHLTRFKDAVTEHYPTIRIDL